jgi:predicted ATP-dependent endonuclease of OLD family
VVPLLSLSQKKIKKRWHIFIILYICANYNRLFYKSINAIMFKLTLKNYRGFLNEEFDFSRINILIGENSAGKSSILKFLLALKQSFRAPNNREYNLTLSGLDTDLGNYAEIIYNHEIDRNLGFSFEFKKDYFDYFLNRVNAFPNNILYFNDIFDREKNITNYLKKCDETPTILNFELSHDLSNHHNIIFSAENANIGKLSVYFDKKYKNKAEQEIYLMGEKPKCNIMFESKHYNKTYYIENIEYEKFAFLTIPTNSAFKDKIATKNNPIYSESELSHVNLHIIFLLMGQDFIMLNLVKIQYINPLLHNAAERIYIDSDKKKIYQIKNIKDLVDFLDDNNIKDFFPDFKIRLTNVLSEFGIAQDFLIKKQGSVKEFRVLLNDLEHNIKDVGFGVSLQLPIFAQALFSEKIMHRLSDTNIQIFVGETLLIEQPEVHLHPRLQAKFIETLLSIGNNNVYFIETHSEHIIRMLQVLVKNKKFDLKPEDISIHYFRKEGNLMLKSAHKINPKNGKLNPNFPKGFYDVSYDLAFQLMD